MKALNQHQVQLTAVELERLLKGENFEETAERIAEIAPDLTDALQAIERPELVVRCIVGTPHILLEHRIYAQPEGAAAIVQRAQAELGTATMMLRVEPTAIPALISRLTRIGPRSTRRTLITTDASLVDDLLSENDMLRLSAFHSVQANWAWSVELHTPQSDPESLTGVDGDDGLALVETIDGATSLVPALATRPFEVFTTVLN